MRQVLWLAPTEAKCIGSACRHPKPCARRDIPLDKGRKLADFSQPMAYVPECSAPKWAKHVSYEDARKPEAAPVIKEWVGR